MHLFTYIFSPHFLLLLFTFSLFVLYFPSLNFLRHFCPPYPLLLFPIFLISTIFLSSSCSTIASSSSSTSLHPPSDLGSDEKCRFLQDPNLDFSARSRLLFRSDYFGNFMLQISNTVLQGTWSLFWKFVFLMTANAIDLVILLTSEEFHIGVLFTYWNCCYFTCDVVCL
jgi:hypothetical protein